MCSTRQPKPRPTTSPKRLRAAEHRSSRLAAPALAPELVARILELAVEGTTQPERNVLLLRGSQVCRAWRLQAQRLLLRRVCIVGVEWDRARVQSLLRALEGGAAIDHLAFDLVGLPCAVRVLKRATVVKHVELLGSDLVMDPFETGSLSERWAFAQTRFLNFIRRPIPDLRNTGITSTSVGSAWWHYPATSAWVATVLRTAAPTLKHLTLDLRRLNFDNNQYRLPRQCPHSALLDTLSALPLDLTLLRVANGCPTAAARVFAANPCVAARLFYARTVDRDITGAFAQCLEGFSALSVPLHELHLDVPVGLTKAGPCLLACLGAPAVAGLKVLVLTGRWADTFVRMKDWRVIGEKARARGIVVRVYDTGLHGEKEPQQVAVVLP